VTAPQRFEVRLVAARPLSPTVRELVLERTDGTPLAFEPGQWLNLMLPVREEGGDSEGKKAYSVASPPDGTPRFELAVTRVAGGAASDFLHGLAVGATLPANGPHGLFTRAPDDPKPALFVATGTGLSPLRSMLLSAWRAKSTAPLWLLFGCRFEEDVLYRAELEELAREDPRFRYEVTLSRPGEGWSGRRGYVQEHVPELWRELGAKAGEAPQVYVCGLDRMVSTVRDLVRKELGAERRSVHYERYD